MISKIEENRVRRLDKEEAKSKIVYEVPLIITYCHNAKLLKEVLRKRQPLLDASFSQTQVRPRLSYRRQRNISDLLIQKGLRKPIVGNLVEEHILELCGSRSKYRIPCPCKGAHDQQVCRCCAHLKVKLEHIEVRLHKKVNCESKNLIYLLGCKVCNKIYVGETQQQLRDRFLQHLNNVYKLSQPLYIHFRQVHKAENIYISVLESVRSSDHTFRKIREAWWINKLQSLEPRGFNIKLECSQIYQASNITTNIERRRSSKWI